jgi:hypothetical protein
MKYSEARAFFRNARFSSAAVRDMANKAIQHCTEYGFGLAQSGLFGQFESQRWHFCSGLRHHHRRPDGVAWYCPISARPRAKARCAH